jgi:hypothetical protein
MVFGFTSVLRVQYMMGCRNSYFKGMEDGQMTPCGYPNFNTQLKNLHVLVFPTDQQTDGQTDGDINPAGGGWVTYRYRNIRCQSNQKQHPFLFRIDKID